MRRPSLPRPRALVRRPVLIAAALLAVVGGGFLLVRDAQFFAVEEVAVTGATGPDAPKIEAALRDAARGMTTLHVRKGRLEEVVDGYPTVERVEVDRDLPHTLTLRVVERTSVGIVQAGGRRVPVTAGGRLLTGATPPADLPLLSVEGDVGARVDDPRGKRLLELMAHAPEPLRRRGRRAYMGPNGLTLAMREGPSLYFGTTLDLRAKWAAAARVLADPAAEGARYVDVRVPGRVAVGGLPLPATDEAETAAPSATAATAEPQAQPQG